MAPTMNLFLGALGLLFIGLKLSGHIDWDWLLVLSPLIAVPAIAVAAYALAFAIAVFFLSKKKP